MDGGCDQKQGEDATWKKTGKVRRTKAAHKKKSRKQNKAWVGNKLLAHRGTLVGGS